MAAGKRRRRKEQRAYKARNAAYQAIRTAEVVTPRETCPITDVSHLVASPADVMKAGVASEPLRWVIASCGPMGERKAVMGLRERRISAYLPMHRFCRYRHGRKVIVERPLMVGYLFVGLTPRQTKHDLAAVDGIGGVLESNGRVAEIGPWVIVQLGAMEASGAFDHTGEKKSAFSAGQPVKITGGQFIGHLATVMSIATDDVRVQVEGKMIHGVVHLAANQIAPVDMKVAA